MESPEVKSRICLVGEVVNEAGIVEDAKKLKVPTIHAPVAFCLSDSTYDTIFVLKRFEGQIFSELKRDKRYVLGPTAVKELLMLNQPLLKRPRPTYCLSMKGLSICLSGFNNKEDAENIMSMIKYMCGSVYKEPQKMTHLVSQTCLSDKYGYAVVFEKPIMSKEWVIKCWERRHEVGFRADSVDMLKFKMKVFCGLYISFKNFTIDETKDMERMLSCNGGIFVELTDSRCTHVVINEYDYEPGDLTSLPKKAFWMKSVWFWKCIQFNIKIVEEDYLINVEKSDKMEPQCVQETTCLNRTNHPTDSGIYIEESYNATIPIFSTDYKQSDRRNIFMELYQTEVNYIKVLNTLQQMKNYCLTQGEEMIIKSEVDLIFSHFDSIKKLHDSLLWELNALCIYWEEDCQIGKVVQNFSRGILQAYTPFIEKFDSIEETIATLSNSKPRFYAYLQLKRLESNKQHLKDLIIRPVQRLPSMVLLIKELIQKTDKNSRDYEELILSQAELELALSELNSRKDKFTNYFMQFKIFKAISNSPSGVLSSTRQYILSFRAVQIGSGISKPGEVLYFFLFSDILQVCKLRKRCHPQGNQKTAETLMEIYESPFKHLQLFSHRDITMLIDMENGNGLNKLIIIVKVESDEKRYIFQFLEDMNESELLEILHKYFSLNYSRSEVWFTKETVNSYGGVLDCSPANGAKKLIKKVKKMIK